MEYGHGGDWYTYQGILDFSANINPLGTPEEVREAAVLALERMDRYPDSRCRKLTRELSGYLGVGQEKILFGNGAADLIYTLVFAEKPKRAVVAVPTFTEYAQALKAVDCEIVSYHLQKAGQFALEEDYLDLLTEDTDMIFLCSPNNPTGQTIPKELLKQILKRCVRYHIRMVVDECFYDFLEKPDSATMQPFVCAPGYPQLVIVRAFTKLYAMPELRLGYLLCSDTRLLERMQQARQPWSVSQAAQEAGIAALQVERKQGWSARTREYVMAERERMETEFHRLGIVFWPSEVNYLLLWSEMDLLQLLLARGILIRDCANYEGLEKGYYRIAVRTKEENMRLLAELENIRCR